MSMSAEMVAGRHAFLALLRGGEVAFNILTIWRHCLACCLLLLLSISAFGADLRGVVVRVTDGDTIVIQSGEEQYKIRLSGIDAPEIRQAFGREARPALAGPVGGKAIVIVWEKKGELSASCLDFYHKHVKTACRMLTRDRIGA